MRPWCDRSSRERQRGETGRIAKPAPTAGSADIRRAPSKTKRKAERAEPAKRSGRWAKEPRALARAVTRCSPEWPGHFAARGQRSDAIAPPDGVRSSSRSAAAGGEFRAASRTTPGGTSAGQPKRCDHRTLQCAWAGGHHRGGARGPNGQGRPHSDHAAWGEREPRGAERARRKAGQRAAARVRPQRSQPHGPRRSDAGARGNRETASPREGGQTRRAQGTPDVACNQPSTQQRRPARKARKPDHSTARAESAWRSRADNRRRYASVSPAYRPTITRQTAASDIGAQPAEGGAISRGPRGQTARRACARESQIARRPADAQSRTPIAATRRRGTAVNEPQGPPDRRAVRAWNVRRAGPPPEQGLENGERGARETQGADTPAWQAGRGARRASRWKAKPAGSECTGDRGARHGAARNTPPRNEFGTEPPAQQRRAPAAASCAVRRAQGGAAPAERLGAAAAHSWPTRQCPPAAPAEREARRESPGAFQADTGIKAAGKARPLGDARGAMSRNRRRRPRIAIQRPRAPHPRGDRAAQAGRPGRSNSEAVGITAGGNH